MKIAAAASLSLVASASAFAPAPAASVSRRFSFLWNQRRKSAAPQEGFDEDVVVA